jgi:hypothetical protein
VRAVEIFGEVGKIREPCHELASLLPPLVHKRSLTPDLSVFGSPLTASRLILTTNSSISIQPPSSIPNSSPYPRAFANMANIHGVSTGRIVKPKGKGRAKSAFQGKGRRMDGSIVETRKKVYVVKYSLNRSFYHFEPVWNSFWLVVADML